MCVCVLRNSRASFLHRRKRVREHGEKGEEWFVFPRPDTVSEKRVSLHHPARFAPSSYFSRRIFTDRQLVCACEHARARPVIGGRCRSNCARRPVSICRSDYFVPPKRADCACSRRQFAISCQFCYLSRCVRATRVRRPPYFVRPSFRSIGTRAGGTRAPRYPMQPNRGNKFDECSPQWSAIFRVAAIGPRRAGRSSRESQRNIHERAV